MKPEATGFRSTRQPDAGMATDTMAPTRAERPDFRRFAAAHDGMPPPPTKRGPKRSDPFDGSQCAGKPVRVRDDTPVRRALSAIHPRQAPVYEHRIATPRIAPLRSDAAAEMRMREAALRSMR